MNDYRLTACSPVLATLRCSMTSGSRRCGQLNPAVESCWPSVETLVVLGVVGLFCGGHLTNVPACHARWSCCCRVSSALCRPMRLACHSTRVSLCMAVMMKSAQRTGAATRSRGVACNEHVLFAQRCEVMEVLAGSPEWPYTKA